MLSSTYVSREPKPGSWPQTLMARPTRIPGSGVTVNLLSQGSKWNASRCGYLPWPDGTSEAWDIKALPWVWMPLCTFWNWRQNTDWLESIFFHRCIQLPHVANLCLAKPMGLCSALELKGTCYSYRQFSLESTLIGQHFNEVTFTAKVVRLQFHYPRSMISIITWRSHWIGVTVQC